jgi:hypothetical protein
MIRKDTMRGWISVLICAILGLVMLVCGLLVPVHLRAVDAYVIEDAGRQTPGLVRQGLELAEENNLGAARLFWQAASQVARLPDRDQLGLAVTNLAAQHAAWMVLGSPNLLLEKLLPRSGVPSGGAGAQAGVATHSAGNASEPFTELLVPREVRERALGLLEASTEPAIRELLRCRALTNTVIFPPSASASGQVFDTAVAVCGLLLEEKKLHPDLSHAVYDLAWAANHGGRAPAGARTVSSGPSGVTEPIEQVLLDLMSLGQRFDWGQLEVFTRSIQDAAALHAVAYLVRKAGTGQVPVLYAAVVLSGQAGKVAGYGLKFSETGLADLGSALPFGAGGIKELLARDQRWYNSGLRRQLAAWAPLGALLGAASDYSLLMPWFAMGVKWFLYLASGFLLAAAVHFSRPEPSTLEQPLQVGGIHIAREAVFAVGFLLVVLLLSEPFLSQESQKEELPFRVRLPLVGKVQPAAASNLKPSFMNPINLLTLLLFFVLQALVYTACLLKLAEIRRQRVLPRIKIKLLENEDHLFDAGLYLGFVGTIISFILVSLGVVKFSIMAAYSSTSFGIIFVSIFKIFHLRPLRRRYLLESEAASALGPEAAGHAPIPTLATPS